jgi:hypothetical protein
MQINSSKLKLRDWQKIADAVLLAATKSTNYQFIGGTGRENGIPSNAVKNFASTEAGLKAIILGPRKIRLGLNRFECREPSAIHAHLAGKFVFAGLWRGYGEIEGLIHG